MARFGAYTVIGALFLCACGEKEEAAQPSATTPEATAEVAGTPYPQASGAELKSGTEYTTRAFKPALRFTPGPGEWKAELGDQPGHIGLAATVEAPADQAILAFHVMDNVADPDKGATIPGDLVAAPKDFAQWLSDHPRLEVTRPKPVEKLGLEGVSIDVRARSFPQKVPDKCVPGKCLPLFYDGVDLVYYENDDKARFYVLELPGGGQLVVEQWVTPAGSFRTEGRRLEATLETASLADAP